MKDLSFFLLKNGMAAKMKKGFKNFCNDDYSTSTLNQQKTTTSSVDHLVSSPYTMQTTSPVNPRQKESEKGQITLEEMLLKLDLEEKMAISRAKLKDYGQVNHRMSCVNSSDILRTARNALNQYPRFSLDGKDAMYRSSFHNTSPILNTFTAPRKSVQNNLPPTIAGEKVIWCKPGVVAKLMGLEALPIPVNCYKYSKERFSAIIKKQNLRKRAERYEMEKRRERVNNVMSSCSRNGCCVMKPVAMENLKDYQEVGWPMRSNVLYRNRNVV